MSQRGGSLLRRYVPAVSANPLALALRLLRSPNPAARSALAMALAGVALAPLDALLARRERRRYAGATPPVLPIVLVCGPPRSGTTLVARYLIDRLEVAYINNLASLFPNAPLAANDLFGAFPRRAPDGYDAFYGRSRGLSGVNDGLFVWDRWLGSDRGAMPSRLLPGAEESLPRFFGALQARSGRPVVNKVNRLFACAALVAPLLPSAIFVCLRRERLMLAQSLLRARDEIVGDRALPYGPRHEDPCVEDPVEDVCRQVEFYERRIDAQERLLGPERFVVLRYEEFCAEPEILIEALERRTGGALAYRGPTREGGARRRFEVSRARRLPPDTLAALERRLERGPGCR